MAKRRGRAVVIVCLIASLVPSPVQAADDLATRPALFDRPGGPREKLREIGVGVDLSLTHFYQGLTSGDGDKSWRYAGKGDAIANIDGHKLGLWPGLSARLHQEFVYGKDANAHGDGTVIPVNTATAFADDFETSFTISQQFSERVSLSVGKFNMLDAASRTPLMGGGGLDTFMNTALAAPISGVTPPYILGGSLSLRTERASFGLFIYDPRNAEDSDVLRMPFDDGVTFSVSTGVPIEIWGRRGFQNLRAVYSTQKGIDLRDVPQLALPAELRDEPGKKDPHWYVAYSFQQFLHHDAADPRRGWGLFGQVGLSDGNPNPISAHVLIGLGGNSFIPNRSDDLWGIAYFNYQLSDDLSDAALRDLGVRFGDEEGIEAYYNLAVTPWLRVTGDAQYVDPFPAGAGGSLFFGVRLQTKL